MPYDVLNRDFLDMVRLYDTPALTAFTMDTQLALAFKPLDGRKDFCWCFLLYDVHHAMKPGVSADRFEGFLHAMPGENIRMEVDRFLCRYRRIESLKIDLTGELGGHGPGLKQLSGQYSNWSVRRSVQDGAHTWSPFANIDPLTRMPDKWTLDSAIRVLHNGQYDYVLQRKQGADLFEHDGRPTAGGERQGRDLARWLVDYPEVFRVEFAQGLLLVHQNDPHLTPNTCAIKVNYV